MVGLLDFAQLMKSGTNHDQNRLPNLLGKVVPRRNNLFQFWVQGRWILVDCFRSPKPPNFRRYNAVWYVTFAEGCSFPPYFLQLFEPYTGTQLLH